MRTLLSVLFGVCLMAGLTSCASTQGKCSPVNTGLAKALASEGTAAAIKFGGADRTVFDQVTLKIDQTIASGQFNVDVLNRYVSQYGGVYGTFLLPVVAFFEDAYNVNSNVNAQACSVPVLQAISDGIKQGETNATASAQTRLRALKAIK